MNTKTKEELMKQYQVTSMEELTRLWLKDHDPNFSNPHRNKEEYPYMSEEQYRQAKLKECLSYNDDCIN